MNKHYLTAILLVIILFIPSCHRGKKYDYAYSMNDPRLDNPSITKTELRNQIVIHGDIKAYEDLKIWYYDMDYQQEILFYSFLMANKYDYVQAYYDVFHNLVIEYYVNEWSIDDTTADLAMSYLFKAAEKEHDQAKEEVQKIIEHEIKGSKEQVRFLYGLDPL